MQTKQELRKKQLEIRGRIPPEEAEKKSRRIFEKLMAGGYLEQTGITLCYMDFRGEVATGDILRYLLAAGKRVALPRVTKTQDGTRDLIIYEVKDMAKDLEKGTYGIMEPLREGLPVLDAKEIDRVIVPGVAFDLYGSRIGYGAGYYDIFLKKTRSDCLKIGLAFEEQVVERIPADPEDIPMDIIITDQRIISHKINMAEG